MKTEAEIRAKFAELVEQRDRCTSGSAARTMLNERIRALGWVFGHESVPELKLSEEAFLIYDCLA